MRKSAGFTLIELLLTIAIVLILGGLSSPFYARFLTQNNVLNVTDQLTGQMRKAQIYAMMGRQNNAWGVALDNDKIVLFQGNSFASRNNSFDEKFNLNPNISISGLTELVFSEITGLPSTTPTITISGNNTVQTLIVNSQGVINKQ